MTRDTFFQKWVAMKGILKFLGVSALLLSTNLFAVSDEEYFNSAIDAYIYGYPLVVMDATREQATNVATPESNRAPINQFAHARELPTATNHFHPRPNCDTLASFAWLDLSQDAYVLHLPTIPEHYFVVECIDAWSNVITSMGPRTTGSNAQDFLITGPNFQDEVPDNLTQIASSTNMFWIIVRTQCYGKNDVAEVTAIQNLMTLVPLASYGQFYAPPRNSKVNTALDTSRAPRDVVQAMDGSLFFKSLAKLIQQNPPASQDVSIVAKMANLGVVSGQDPAFTDSQKKILQKVPAAALTKIRSNANSMPRVMTDWNAPLVNVGQYGVNYLQRAYIADVALGANLPQDILSIVTDHDVNGTKLDGRKRYRIHIDASQVIPVNAFWSLTMYGPDQYLVPNAQNRYVLHSFTALAEDTLQYNDDGSLDIILQKDKPNTLPTNWLPTPSGNFLLVMRLYWPQNTALGGSYIPPSVNPAGS